MRKACLALLLLSVLAFPILASPSDNFLPGGLEIGGSGYLQLFGRSDLPSYSEYTLSLSPYLSFFALPGLALGLSVDLLFSGESMGSPLSSTQDTSVSASAQYYLPLGKDEDNRFFLSLGGSLGQRRADQTATYLNSVPVYSFVPNMRYKAWVELYCFVTDTIAPYAGLSYIGSSYEGYTNTYSYATLFFGLSFFLPTKTTALIK
jgi:hypothetical protein